MTNVAQAICTLTGLLILLAACRAASGHPEQAVETYLAALINRDQPAFLASVCGSFERDALLEYDSFRNVEATLNGLDCPETESSSSDITVHCSGEIRVTYAGETRSIDLSVRRYSVSREDDLWLVCGVESVP